MSIIRFFNNLLFEVRLAKSVRKANRLHNLTGRRYLVIPFRGRPVVKSKQHLKELIRAGKLRCTIARIEELALYITQ